MWYKIISFLAMFCYFVNSQMQLPNKVLADLQVELRFETLLILQSSTDCLVEQKEYRDMPSISLNLGQKFHLRRKFKRAFLALVCLESENYLVFEAIHAYLQDMLDTPTIFLINQCIDVLTLLKKCFANKMLNVLAMGNWSREHIYSYRAFPHFKLVKRRLYETKRYFEPQLQNLGGYPITTLADNVFPRTCTYKDAQNNVRLVGYLMPFIENFAKTLNATLKIRWNTKNNFNSIIDMSEVNALIQSGEVDIPAVISNVGYSFNWKNFSSVVEQSKWQLMFPLESEIDRRLLIFGYTDAKIFVLLLSIFFCFSLIVHNVRRFELGLAPSLNCLGTMGDTMLRASLTQAFPMPVPSTPRVKWIYGWILFSCLICYNLYITGLETVLVHPPLNPAIRNYEDIRRSGLKIMAIKKEADWIFLKFGWNELPNYKNVFEVVNSSMFQAMRSQPNNSYAYPITQTLWPHIKRKFIKQKQASFRLSKEFVLDSHIAFAIPLPGDSIYKQALNHYIQNVHGSGLFSFWQDQSFYELVAIGKTSQLPYVDITQRYHLCLEDLYFFWVPYMTLLGISILTFLAELGHALWRGRARQIS